MVVGFTGTRHGWTAAQETTVARILDRVQPEMVVHGGCIGSDTQFDTLCQELEIPRRIYPANNVPSTLIGKVDHSDPDVEFMTPAPAPGRNLYIIADVDFMIGCPGSDHPPVSLRGQGTWHCVQHTRQSQKPLFLVVPSGIPLEERMTEELKALRQPKVKRVFLSTRIRLNESAKPLRLRLH